MASIDERRQQLFGDEGGPCDDWEAGRADVAWHTHEPRPMHKRQGFIGSVKPQNVAVDIRNFAFIKMVLSFRQERFRRSIPHRAIIGGETMAFDHAEEKFYALVSEWRKTRETGSSTDTIINDAYGQIVAMGWDVVPLLLQEVRKRSGHWFTALTWITGHDPVTPSMYGNIRAIREAWLQWGKENGYA